MYNPDKFSIGDVIEFDIGTYTHVGLIIGFQDAGDDQEVTILQHDGRLRKRRLWHDVASGGIKKLYQHDGRDYPVPIWDLWLRSRIP